MLRCILSPLTPPPTSSSKPINPADSIFPSSQPVVRNLNIYSLQLFLSLQLAFLIYHVEYKTPGTFHAVDSPESRPFDDERSKRTPRSSQQHHQTRAHPACSETRRKFAAARECNPCVSRDLQSQLRSIAKHATLACASSRRPWGRAEGETSCNRHTGQLGASCAAAVGDDECYDVSWLMVSSIRMRRSSDTAN